MAWMTWGERITLDGVEAMVVRRAIGYMQDLLQEFDEPPPFIDPFGSLEKPQQLALLWEVGSALLIEEATPPKPSAIRESAVAAIYQTIEGLVEEEIAAADGQSTREAVLAAYRQYVGDEVVDIPDPDCADLDEWSYIIEGLRDHILVDADWEMEELFLDTEPGHAAELKRFSGIAEDYYTDVAPDPSESGLEEIKQKLKDLGA